MLAILGFSIGGLLFALFGMTVAASKNKAIDKIINNYRSAYVLLAIAFFGFAIGSMIGTSRALAISVIIGDLLLLVATLFILNILLEGKNYKKAVLLAVLTMGIAAIAFRVMYFYPKPYLEDEILFFNSQRFVNFVLSSTFLLLWLPVNLRIARLQVANRPEAHQLAKSLMYGYTIAIFAALIFILAKAPLTVLLSFTAMCTCYLMLTVSNLSIRKIKEVGNVKPIK